MGQIAGWWDGLRAVLLDALFPPRCAGCNRPGTLWCATCQASVVYPGPAVCQKCGRPQSYGGLCQVCQRTPLQIDGVRSAALFEGPLREAIHHFKYHHQTALACPLGRLLEACWMEQPLPADVLVPVPLHSARLRERGYNQSALLARRLAVTLSLPVVEDCLVRIRATASQMTLGAAERRTNVEGAFACRDGRLAGRRVLLIDDVCTTGSTLEACSVALSQAGAVSVWAMTLARAV